MNLFIVYPRDGTVNSPEQRNKPVHAAAHSISPSCVGGLRTHCCCSFPSSCGVMGRRCLGGAEDLAWVRFIPSTYSRRGMEVCWKGSPNPCCICTKRSADKYDFMVRCLRCSVLRWATYLHRVSSLSGNALPPSGKSLHSSAGLRCRVEGATQHLR